MTKEDFDLIISDIVNGNTLKVSLAKRGLTRDAFYRFKDENLKCAEAYAAAREALADFCVDEILDIVDDDTIDANSARNRMQARQWIASKLKPKDYSEKLDLNVNQTISLTDAITAARERLLAMRVPEVEVSAEVSESKAIDQSGAAGSKPVERLESKTDTGLPVKPNT